MGGEISNEGAEDLRPGSVGKTLNWAASIIGGGGGEREVAAAVADEAPLSLSTAVEHFQLKLGKDEEGGGGLNHPIFSTQKGQGRSPKEAKKRSEGKRGGERCFSRLLRSEVFSTEDVCGRRLGATLSRRRRREYDEEVKKGAEAEEEGEGDFKFSIPASTLM